LIFEGQKINETLFYKTCLELTPGLCGFNIVVKVIESTVISGTGSHQLSVSIVGDTTASIYLIAQDEQVEIAQVGETLLLKNAKVDMFDGFMRLVVDRWGSIEKAKEPILEVTNQNISEVQYELVDIS